MLGDARNLLQVLTHSMSKCQNAIPILTCEFHETRRKQETRYYVLPFNELTIVVSKMNPEFDTGV